MGNELQQNSEERGLSELLRPLEELEAFRELLQNTREPGYTMLYGPEDSQAAHMLAGLAQKTGRPLLVLTANERRAAQLAVVDVGVDLRRADAGMAEHFL